MTDEAQKQAEVDLMPDAALATDIDDEEERTREQLAHLGGELDPDIDDWDDSGLDRGDDPNAAPAAETEEPDDEEESADEPAEQADEPAEEQDAEADDGAGEAEAEQEPEDDSEPVDEGEDQEVASKTQGIPKHRFDEVNERRKAAEAKLAELEAQNKAAEEATQEVYDFRENEKEYMDLLLDGNTEAALAKREEIDAAREAKWRSESKTDIYNEQSVANTQAQLTAISQEAEKLYPVFDENHADFDVNVTNKVMAFYQGYVASGQIADPTDAFITAIADAVEMYDLDGKYGEKAAAPAEKPAPKKQPAKKEALAKQVHKPIAGEGDAADSSGTNTPDLSKMTDEELDALPAKTLAKLRGDFI